MLRPFHILITALAITLALPTGYALRLSVDQAPSGDDEDGSDMIDDDIISSSQEAPLEEAPFDDDEDEPDINYDDITWQSSDADMTISTKGCDSRPSLHIAGNRNVDIKDRDLHQQMVKNILAIATRPLNEVVHKHVLENGHIELANSPDRSDYTSSVWNATIHAHGPVPRTTEKETCSQPIHQDVVGFRNWFSSGWEYGHTLADRFPMLAHIYNTAPPDARIVVEFSNQKSQDIFKLLGDDLYKRILWVKAGQHVCTSKTLTWYTIINPMSPHFLRLATLADEGRDLIEKAHPTSAAQNKVIFLSRHSGQAGVHHGRGMTVKHEQEILRVIRQKLIQHKRQEKLVIFNGYQDGHAMTAQQQFDLFHQARLIVGPHGTGFGNVLWMQKSSSCKSQPDVIEFMCGSQTTGNPQCNHKTIPAKTYWALQALTSWVKYHHILFTNVPSDPSSTYINLNDLKLALDAVFT